MASVAGHRGAASDGQRLESNNAASQTKGSSSSQRDLTLLPKSTEPVAAHHTAGRRSSFFSQRKASGRSPIAIHFFEFYRELWSYCGISSDNMKCVPLDCAKPNLTLMEEGLGTDYPLDVLDQLDMEESLLLELRHQLFLKAIHHLNPSLTDGCLFVDGLFEVLSRKIPWPYERKGSEAHQTPRELLSSYSHGSLVLHQYWLRPDNPSDIAPYLTVGASFVQYIHSKYGSQGIAQFLKGLDCSGKSIPCSDDVIFKNLSLLTLEFKWKKHVEAEVNEKFRLSILGFLKLLFCSYLFSHWFRILLVLMICVTDVSLHLAFAIIFSRLLEFGFKSESVAVVGKWVGAIIGVIIMRFVLLNVNAAILSSLSVNISSIIRKQIAARVHRVSYKFLCDHTASEITSIFSEDVGSIESFVSLSIYTVLWAGLMLALCISYALYVVWPVGLPLGVVFVSMKLLVQWVSSILDKHTFSKMQAQNKLCDILKETIDGFSENHVYMRGGYWQTELYHTIEKHYIPKAFRSMLLTQFIQFFQLVVPNCIGALLVFSLILTTVYEWTEFKRSVSVYIMYQLTVVSMASAAGQVAIIQAAQVAMGRVNALLNNRDHDITVKKKHLLRNKSKVLVGSKSLEVEFKNVYFCYSPISSHWNICDVSFKVEGGERVAVVGETGSGKSTLLSLLLQMYQPNSGRVLVGGRELSGRSSKSLAATFQTNHIFNMSILENIRFGNLSASNEAVEEAAKMAEVHDWISSLSRGYDTVLRSNGTSLSGGQRQRLAIARMLVTDASVLVLDEVTSALDPATEQRVFDTLMRVTRGRTVVAVTHRLEQARQFDKILVLSHGHVKEYGSHQELMKMKGTYYHIAKREKGEGSPHQPTPIVRRHSLTHLPKISIHNITPSVKSSTPTIDPSPVVTTPFLGVATPIPIVTTPLGTVDECEEHSDGKTKSTSCESVLKNQQLNIVGADIENPLPMDRFPTDLPSSTPFIALSVAVDQK